MNPVQRRTTMEDVLAAIGVLTEQIGVLVSAVDDLRCEIEWQGRNGAFDQPTTVEKTNDETADLVDSEPPASEIGPTAERDDSLLSAAGRLRAFEQSLMQGRRSSWSDDWATNDDFVIPEGRLVSVDADLWAAVLDVRPAHVVGEGCDCEEDMGPPYLLAWRDGDKFLLRELTRDEAYEIQHLCMRARFAADVLEQQPRSNSSAAGQIRLF